MLALYCGVHMAVWLVAYPAAEPVLGVTGPSFVDFAGFALVVLGTGGAVTMLLAVCAGLGHVRMPVDAFRARLGLTMAALTLPLWATVLLSPIALVETLVAGIFALLMPTPLIPENWEAPPTPAPVPEGPA
ncbi:hypothetical protein [Streptomyces sp. NBC_01233]|uniref:hypothetical protein n=1 Tax=Streptomyces sp. NBC_01233 TaxID=2903787 RepID=UPI002E140A29|nr:hypothetical protein OG332_04905 [Streptomyces sp. NBC_01233]